VSLPCPFAPEHDRDPYPVLDELRESGPVRRVLLSDGQPVWLVTRADEARWVLRAAQMSKDPRNASAEWLAANAGNPMADRSMLAPNLGVVDPPDHTRLRKLVAPAFGVARMRALTGYVQGLVDDLVDEMAKEPAVDFVAAFAEPLPTIVICELLGIAPGDRVLFRHWVRDIVASDPTLSQQESAARRRDGAGKLNAYLTDLVERKRAAPGDDLISLLLAGIDGDRLSLPELQSMLFVLLIGGYETTLNMLANMLLRLLEHPDQWRLLVRDPGRSAAALEELLRYDGSVKTTFWRFPTEPVTLGDVTIEAGEPVMVSIAAVNRDPAANPEPYRLDLDRPDSRHLAFGHGAHYCVGAPLARLEGTVTLTTLARRCPELRLTTAPESLDWQHSPIVRGPRELPVALGPVRER